MLNKLKLALFFIAGSTPTKEELQEARALELQHFLNIRLRNASAFKYTGAPEATDVIAGTITEAIKKSYPATPIVTIDGEAPEIVTDPTGTANSDVVKGVDQMTVDELVAYVSGKGYEITGFAGMNKADKVAAIVAHEHALSNPDPNQAAGAWS